jgi:hypothetical protein
MTDISQVRVYYMTQRSVDSSTRIMTTKRKALLCIKNNRISFQFAARHSTAESRRERLIIITIFVLTWGYKTGFMSSVQGSAIYIMVFIKRAPYPHRDDGCTIQKE